MFVVGERLEGPGRTRAMRNWLHVLASAESNPLYGAPVTLEKST